MNRAPLLAVAVLAAVVTVRGASVKPVATVASNGWLTIAIPPRVLESEEVRKQLTSGLTTAFVITVTAGDSEGGARIAVRYELWEEEYRVTALDVTGREQKLVFDSMEKLTAWWKATPLVVMVAYYSESPVRVSLKVLPFSAREQAETQRWLSRMLTSMHSVKEAPVNKRADPGAARMMDIIVGTSIESRPILEHRWTVEVRRAQ
ncbi:MAG TPA: hypothetical protein VFT12_02650 [Thermoanaerobaculia bacterium]|nr:hypothetical protein [Thermoanaerobaculia bacterium]